MTDKNTIDEVNVSKCKYFNNGWCLLSESCDAIRYRLCGDMILFDCHYRNWQRKEQECNKLYIQLKADEEYHKEEENTLRKIIKNKEERNIELYKENNKLKQTLAEIKEIAEPYRMIIKKICGNCKKYDDCHACCYKDINCYKYTSAKTNACEEFTYLDEFVPNILANNILQKISECEAKNE